MTTQTEALKLALKALECLKRDFDSDQFEWGIADKAITAIKEALAQPEPKCVACEGRPSGDNDPCSVCGLAQPEQEPVGTVAVNDWIEMERAVGYRDGYEAALKQVAQPEQEPVAVWELQEDGWDTICDGDWLETLPVGTKLYTTPPKAVQEPVKGFMWSYLGVDGKERFEFSSFGKTKTKAQKHFNFQNNAQRLEPVKRHKLYAVSMTFTSEPQNDRT